MNKKAELIAKYVKGLLLKSEKKSSICYHFVLNRKLLYLKKKTLKMTNVVFSFFYPLLL